MTGQRLVWQCASCGWEAKTPVPSVTLTEIWNAHDAATRPIGAKLRSGQRHCGRPRIQVTSVESSSAGALGGGRIVHLPAFEALAAQDRDRVLDALHLCAQDEHVRVQVEHDVWLACEAGGWFVSAPTTDRRDAYVLQGDDEDLITAAEAVARYRAWEARGFPVGDGGGE